MWFPIKHLLHYSIYFASFFTAPVGCLFAYGAAIWLMYRTLAIYSIFWLISPLISGLFVFFLFYRKGLEFYLASIYGSSFKGFMDGMDSIFTSDEMRSFTLSSLAFIEVSKRCYQKDNTANAILKKMREKVDEAFFQRPWKVPKLLYKRKSEWGYNFWVEEEPGTVRKYVRYLRDERNTDNEEEFNTIEDLQKIVAQQANNILPDGDTRNFEILVGDRGIDDGEIVKFPVRLNLP